MVGATSLVSVTVMLTALVPLDRTSDAYAMSGEVLSGLASVGASKSGEARKRTSPPTTSMLNSAESVPESEKLSEPTVSGSAAVVTVYTTLLAAVFSASLAVATEVMVGATSLVSVTVMLTALVP